MTSSLQLSEQDFVCEGYHKRPFSFWFWMIATLGATSLLWAGYNGYEARIVKAYEKSPFLKVTNREMSLFLWQDPVYMRINAPAKSIYMPGFQYIEKISLELTFADDYVMAPPPVLFRYHAWSRLLKKEFVDRPILKEEFNQFLNYAEEWQPQHWVLAPREYRELLESLGSQGYLEKDLPLAVRLAFQGWKNYFLEGDKINAMTFSIKQIKEFLKAHPGYDRSHWIYIEGPHYLLSLLIPSSLDEKAIVPSREIPAFLRVALFNYFMSKEH